MNLKELYEGAEPKLPGAPKGVQIMTPQQFVAKSAEGEEPEPSDELDENLHKWFKEKWVRFGPDGKIRGDCARGDDSEGKPKCLPQSKAHSLGKKGRASAAARKRREDPNPERSGAAINVATKKKSNEDVMESEKRCMQCGMTNCSCPAGSCKCKPIKGWIPNKGFQKVQEEQLDEKCWDTHKQVGMKNKGGKMVPNCVPKESVEEAKHSCPHCGGPMFEAAMMNEKKDACYYKVKSRYKVWPSAYASGALVKCRKRGAKNWGSKSESVDEDLSRRGFLKGLGAAALGAAGMKAQAQTDQEQDLGDGFVLVTIPFRGDTLKAVLDKQTNTYYTTNRRADGTGAIIRSIAPYIMVRGDQASTAMNVGPATLAAMKKAGLDGVKEQAMAEATKLAAPTRPIGDPELTDYLDRIRNQEKKKTDKYKLPYIHRSSVVGYYNQEGKKYNTDAIKQALAERPKALLKKNEKMKHSDGEQEQFFNIGFAALVGIALDEQTNELIIVNTCPGAGSCKVDCFAMKGGKVQFAGPWLSDGRILTYLLNDPKGFFEQLKAEITKEELKGKKGDYSVSIRWHDAGDFFSPEYAAMAFKLASELPNVDFYAYTKVADVALGNKPKNFIINWSEGASSSQEKKVKGADANLEKTKNSRIVPSNLFYDLLVKDEKKNLVKGPEGQWQVIPDKLPELKQRLAKEYGISPNSILSYTEWDQKGKKIPNMKWNVIITPGEPDLTAKDPGVLSTLLLKH